MRDNKIVIILLGVIAVFIIGVILYLLKSVLLPLVVAIFLSYLFKPLMIYLKKRRIPVAVSLIAVLLVIGVVLFGLSLIIYSSVNSFVDEAPKYQTRVNEIASDLQAWMTETAARYDISTSELDWRSAFNVSSITSILGAGLGSTVTLLGNIILMLIYMFFILTSSGDLVHKIRHSFNKDQSEKVARIVTNIDKQVRQYLMTKTAISLMSGTITTVILLIFGVDFALFWGFLTFMLNYIPNIGSIVSEVFPVLLAFLQFDSFVTPLIIFALLLGTDTIMGNVVEPKMMAFSLNLSPLVVLVALIFWGWLWGVVGMIIAVPLTAILKIALENIEELEPLAKLMGGSLKKDPAPIVNA